ncbi:META domain-containing protein [Motiliproteus sediminis]|uniref:META domain-containing protein n=1 Tax=Motiliproteus sediminis TaxID=1468178 RepID=UPI001AF00BDC|nr:META domain-containing protein [Motiliproteus sediminis]
MLKGLLPPLLIALTLYGCAGPASRVVDPRTLSTLTVVGEVYTQGYSALDPGHEMHMQVRRYSRDGNELVADIPIRPTHVSSSLEFAISVPAPRDPASLDEMRVVVTRGQRLELASDPIPLKVTLDPVPAGQLLLKTADEVRFGQTYQCGDQQIVYGNLGGHPQLLARGMLHRLQARGSSDAGQRYWSLDQDTTQLVDNGERLLVALADQRLPECLPRQGLSLPQSARGQGPDWYLHLSSQLLQFEQLGSNQRLSAANLGDHGGGEALRYLGAENFAPIVARFQAQLCRGSDSPLPYPYAVDVITTDDHFEGCGGEPHALLTERYWQVNRLGDVPPVSRAPINFRFEADGRLTGYSACNRFSSQWKLENGQLLIGKIQASKMACRPRLANQEQLLFGLLENMQRFDITPNGALELEGSLGTIKAFTDPRQLR